MSCNERQKEITACPDLLQNIQVLWSMIHRLTLLSTVVSAFRSVSVHLCVCVCVGMLGKQRFFVEKNNNFFGLCLSFRFNSA